MLCLAVTKILFDEVNYDKINNFIQDPHKLEEFFDKDKKLWIDDSKATNIDATIKALKNYKDKKIFLILGGDDKGINLNPLFQELKNYDIKIFAIGSNSSKLDKLSLKYNQNCTISNSLENAVNSIKKDINFVAKTSVGLLSPCASSLDFYSSYKQRGEEFKKLVNSNDKS
jgi:UDP-N-acetylmuramoylalanine--D-glutamate ligase